ncbi:hypothetical protein HDU96_001246 [Phlyctochytrium bullatum]|nr:hypothetical protein HDU96_001246 [Phlyctochytrium bullatum]
MTADRKEVVRIVDLRRLDVKVINAVFKVLAKHLGPKFDEWMPSKFFPAVPEFPFGLTITTTMYSDATLALLKTTDARTVKQLLAADADPYEKDASGRLPIELATSPTVWRLFAPRMHSLQRDHFVKAVEHGDAVAVKLLLAAGADPATQNVNGFSAIHLAVFNGHEDVLCTMLDSVGNSKVILDLESGGAVSDVDGRWDGLTPLQLASFLGNVGIVRILLERGAKVEATEKSEDCRALHFAAGGGHADVVHLLLDHGADVGVMDRGHWIPLQRAASRGHTEVCKALVRKNPMSIAVRDNIGDTPLHIAAQKKHMHVAAELLSMGADLSVKNSKMETLLDVARQCRPVNPEMLALLSDGKTAGL